MKTLLNSQQITIMVICIILGVVFLTAVGVLLYVFVISKSKIKHQIRELQKKYSYLNALLIGQDSQYIHRLELISRTNLLYVEKHEQFSNRFKDIFENDDKFVSSYIKQLASLIANNQYKNIKFTISETKKALDEYENEVTKLDKELYELIRLEEESRQAILKYKEDFRRIKQKYYDNGSSLELVSKSLNKVIAKLETEFATYDAHIDSAEYDEAKEQIPTIRDVLVAVNHCLEVIPDMCVLVDEIIPNKIKGLKEEFENLEERLPLYHVGFKQRMESWQTTLKEVKRKLVGLHTNEVKVQIDNILSEIDQTHDMINAEVEAEKVFNEKLNNIYNNTIDVEKTFIKICSLLPEIERVYFFSEERKQKIEELRTAINRLTAARNLLDTFIHSTVMQPYSILMDKLDNLINEYEISNNGVQDFKTYIDSLKKNAEEAYNLVFVYFYRTKQIDAVLHEINLESVIDKYEDQINQCYSSLNDIDTTLKHTPINIDELNTKVEYLKSFASVLFEEIETNYRDSRLAESMIVYTNRDRQQSDVDRQLNDVEEIFYNGEFDKAYKGATSIYHKNHVEDPNAR